jgi:DNA-binding transcriptional regulator GbsR (MarR family)
VSKGAVSTNVRHLERLGMVHKHIQVGSRKDFYLAETDFWQIIKTILKEREKGEFDLALRTVGESLEMVAEVDSGDEQVVFYAERMAAMEEFFETLDGLVVTLMKLENLMALNALGKLARRTNKADQ